MSRSAPSVAAPVGVVLMAFALTLSKVAGANPSGRLVYARGPGADSCPDEETVRSSVAARLGYDPFFAWARTPVVVEVLRGRVSRFAIETH